MCVCLELIYINFRLLDCVFLGHTATFVRVRQLTTNINYYRKELMLLSCTDKIDYVVKRSMCKH